MESAGPIFESPSLNEVLREQGIPCSGSVLGQQHASSVDRQVALCGIVETEMIARVCAILVVERLAGAAASFTFQG
jgi:hypothetical protein